MISLQRTGKKWAAVTVLAAATAVFPVSPAHAQSRDTVSTRVNWNLRGPSGNYVVELFEVGAPYPSRRETFSSGGTAGGAWYSVISYITWYNLHTRFYETPGYFIRVTRNGQSRQSSPFYFWGSTTATANIDLNSSNLLTGSNLYNRSNPSP